MILSGMSLGLDLTPRTPNPTPKRPKPEALHPRLVDPGTVFLFKSASTMIVAAVQCTFAGKVQSTFLWYRTPDLGSKTV